MTTSRLLPVAALALSAALAVTGCGSSSQGAGDHPSAPSTPSAPSPEAPSSQAGTTGKTVPANWKAAPIEGVAQLQVPPSWTITSTRLASQTLRAPKGKVGISPGSGIFTADAFATGDSDVKSNLAELAASTKRSISGDAGNQNIVRLPDVTVNGAPLYHFRYETSVYWQDAFGSVTPNGSDQIQIGWSFQKALIDRNGADALMNQVMATYKPL